MLSINLQEVTVPLPHAVQLLDGSSAERMPTNGNGACAIHSVWGIEDEVSGELVKSNARLFLRDAFGPTVAGFQT